MLPTASRDMTLPSAAFPDKTDDSLPEADRSWIFAKTAQSLYPALAK
jgi:hypothetical protein